MAMDKEAELNSTLRTVVKSSFLVFFSIILSKLLSYAYRIIIANRYGSESYGRFSLSLVVVGIIIAIASFGLHDGLLRYISFYRGKKEFGKIRFIINKSMKILLFTSIISFIGLYYLSEIISTRIFHDSSLTHYLKFISLVLPFSIFAGAFLAIIRAFEKVGTYSFLVNFLHNFFKVLLLVLAIFIGIGENSIVLSYILSYALLLFAAYLFFVAYVKNKYLSKKDITTKEKSKISLELLNYSWPVIFSGIFFSLFFWIDTLVLGSNLDAASVGIYSAAVLLVGLFSFAQDLFIQLFVPLISRNLSIGNKEVIKEVSKQVFKWVFIINIFISLPLIIFPEKIISLFFKGEFIAASTALRILSIGAILSGFIGLLTGLINAIGRTKRVFVYYMIFSAINFVIDVLFVRKYGLEGVALGTSITWILFTLTLYIEVRKLYGFYPIRRAFAKIALAGITSGLLLWTIGIRFISGRVSTIMVLFVFGLVYLALIGVLRVLDYRDMDIIKVMKNKILSSKMNFGKND